MQEYKASSIGAAVGALFEGRKGSTEDLQSNWRIWAREKQLIRRKKVNSDKYHQQWRDIYILKRWQTVKIEHHRYSVAVYVSAYNRYDDDDKACIEQGDKWSFKAENNNKTTTEELSSCHCSVRINLHGIVLTYHAEWLLKELYKTILTRNEEAILSRKFCICSASPPLCRYFISPIVCFVPL